MTGRHRRSARTIARALGVIAATLALYATGLIHGTGVGAADQIATCQETR